jgi:tetratricopeptide (TPR) repeat protein
VVWIGVVYTLLGEEDEAEKSYDVAASLYSDSLQFLNQRAQAYLRVGEVERAQADADEAVSRYPESGWAYAVRANAAVARDDFASAIADLDKAAELGSQSGDAQLEAFARTQKGMIIQLQASQLDIGDSTPESEGE